MDRALLDRVLLGDADAIATFGEAEHCAVVDWRAGLSEMVASVASFLPPGYLGVGKLTDSGAEILVAGRPPRFIALSPPPSQESLLLSISQALQPEFELRQVRPVDGDGHALLVAPSSLWSDIERLHPQATEKLFLSAERLAAYWSKSYLRRMLSKP